MAEQNTLQGQLSIVKQSRTGGYNYGRGTTYPRQFEATGAGADGRIVSSSLKTFCSSDADLTGMLVEIVRAANGPVGERGRGARGRIRSYDYASGAASVEAFGLSSAADDVFYLLDDPGPVISEDTGGSQVTWDDDDRTEAGDYWNGTAQEGGPYAAALVATNIPAGRQRLVSNSLSSGLISTASYGYSTAVGDLAELYKWHEPLSGVPIRLVEGRVPLPSITGTFGTYAHVAGLNEAQIQVELPMHGPGEGRGGSPCAEDDIIACVTAVTAAQADETDQGSSTTSAIDVADAGTAGEMWLLESGDVVVDTDGGAPFTPSPSARIAPASGSAIYGMRTFRPWDGTARTFDLKLVGWTGDGIRVEAVGCVPTLSWSMKQGDLIRLASTFTAADGYICAYDENGALIARPAALDAIPPSVTPEAVDDIRVSIDGVEIAANQVDIDMMVKVVAETALNSPNQKIIRLRGYGDPTIKIAQNMDDTARALLRKAKQGYPMRLLVQAGTTGGLPGVFAWWFDEVRIMSREMTSANDGEVVTNTFTSHKPRTPSGLDQWIIGYR